MHIVTYVDQFTVVKAFIDDIHNNFDPHTITAESFLGAKVGIPRSTSYRNWFWIDMKPRSNAFTSSGYLGQWCYVLPRRRCVIIKLSTWKLPDTWQGYFALFRQDLIAMRALAEQTG